MPTAQRDLGDVHLDILGAVVVAAVGWNVPRVLVLNETVILVAVVPMFWTLIPLAFRLPLAPFATARSLVTCVLKSVISTRTW